MGFSIAPINELKTVYRESCALKFIAYWDLDKEQAVGQTDFRPDIEIEEM